MSEVTQKKLIKVESGVVTIDAEITYDKDQDGRAAAGAKLVVFADLPEVLDESMKDNATAQLLAQWFDANKMLLPKVEKEF